MSGNVDELPDRDGQGDARRSPQARGSSRQRQRDRQQAVAEELDISPGGVGVRERVGGGETFLRSAGAQQFGDQLRSEFAGEADFVTPGDVNPRIDRRAIAAEPVVAKSRRDDVARRARQETASDAEFIAPADLRADVGARGVADLRIGADRRDDVASRAREGLAADDPFARPGDLAVDVGARGITEARFTDAGERRRAARQFESETLLGEVDPANDLRETDSGFSLGDGPQREVAAGRLDDELPDVTLGPSDVTRTDAGFAPTESAQRRQAARSFEAQFDAFGTGELDPAEGLRETDSGFGLSREATREVGAAQLDSQLSDIDVTPDDVTLEADGDTFDVVFEREVRR